MFLVPNHLIFVIHLTLHKRKLLNSRKFLLFAYNKALSKTTCKDLYNKRGYAYFHMLSQDGTVDRTYEVKTNRLVTTLVDKNVAKKFHGIKFCSSF